MYNVLLLLLLLLLLPCADRGLILQIVAPVLLSAQRR